MRVLRALLAVALAALASDARAQSLADLLGDVAANARFPSSTRADVSIERQSADATANTTAILLGRGSTIYLETRDGQRALIHPGKVVVPERGRVRRAPVGTALGRTDVLLEDLAVFSPSVLKVPQISDETGGEVVVTGAPAGASSYVLLVFRIDRAWKAPVRTQYYTQSIGHLAKIRKEGQLVEVAGHWRPTTFVVEDVVERTATRLKLEWHPGADVPPVLFTPAGLRAPSGLSWP